jgi:hypothetical protein
MALEESMTGGNVPVASASQEAIETGPKDNDALSSLLLLLKSTTNKPVNYYCSVLIYNI